MFILHVQISCHLQHISGINLKLFRSGLVPVSRPFIITIAYHQHCSKLVSSVVGLLPARGSEQGNVIGLVSVYMCTKIIVIERTRDLIYLKFGAKDFSPKIISPSSGKNSGDSAYPLLFCSFCLVSIPLPDRSNYLPLCHTHYFTPDQYFTSLCRQHPLPSCELETNTSKFTAATFYCRI